MQISALLLKGGEEVVLVANIKEQKTSRIKVMLLMKKNGMMKRTPWNQDNRVTIVGE